MGHAAAAAHARGEGTGRHVLSSFKKK
jgi:hypothetical protein